MASSLGYAVRGRPPGETLRGIYGWPGEGRATRRSPGPESESARQAPGANRRKETPEVIARVEELMRHDTAGDPVTGIKRSRRTTCQLAEQHAASGIGVSKSPVGRLLKQLHYKLSVNRQQIASAKVSSPSPSHSDPPAGVCPFV